VGSSIVDQPTELNPRTPRQEINAVLGEKSREVSSRHDDHRSHRCPGIRITPVIYVRSCHPHRLNDKYIIRNYTESQLRQGQVIPSDRGREHGRVHLSNPPWHLCQAGWLDQEYLRVLNGRRLAHLFCLNPDVYHSNEKPDFVQIIVHLFLIYLPSFIQFSLIVERDRKHPIHD